jgi:hypothetical protein
MYHTQKCFELIASDITMSNLSNIPGGGGLPDRFRNVGDQIQKYFDFADTDPDRAVPCFVNIWEKQGSLTTRALALQGLGRAAQHGHVKQALADWEVLKDIAKEVKGKGEVSSDLTRWAAAKALEDIGYSLSDLQHLEGGGFTEPLDRIRRAIRDRKLAEINRIQRLNTRRETTAEYERNLEFWVYGPVEELFDGNDNSPNFHSLVKDVIRELHGRGVYLGLISPNLLVQAEALLQAGPIFKESAEIENFLYPFLEDFLQNPNQEISFRINAAEIIHTARDLNRRLKTLSKLLLEEKNPKLQEVALRQAQSLFKQSAEIEEFIYGLLEEFLYNPNQEIALRIYAAEIINTATDLNRRLQTLSKLLLEETNPKLHEVALRQAQSSFYHYGEDFIYGLLEAFLENSHNEIALRIYAAEIINTTTDLSRRLKTLSQLLLEKIELRNAAVRLLTPYKQELARVEPDANTVLDALVFSYSLDTLQQHELQDLTISQLKTEFSSASEDSREISTIFTSAIAASESLARRYGRSGSVLKQFLQNKQDEYLSDLQNWLRELKNNIDEVYAFSNKLDSNYRLLERVVMEQRRLLNEVVIEQGSQIIDLDSSISPTLLYYTLTKNSVHQLQPWNISECQTKNQCQILYSELKIIKNKLKDALINRISDLESTNRRKIYGVDTIFLLFLLPILFLVIGSSQVTTLGIRSPITTLLIILLLIILLLIILSFIISGGQNKKKQEIIYFLRYLTNNWQ